MNMSLVLRPSASLAVCQEETAHASKTHLAQLGDASKLFFKNYDAKGGEGVWATTLILA